MSGRRGPAASRRFEDLITIGTVIKPQGRHGEMVVQPHSDRPDRFPDLKHAFVPGPDGTAREVSVTRTWPHKGRFVVKLEGVDSIDDAELYRGMDLRIGEDELEALPAGSYYHHQLIGLDVLDEKGTRVGEVAAIEHHGEVPTIVVRGGYGRELMLPFVDDFVKQVDVEHRVVRVHLPDDEQVAR
jgi:16S rRNA processing protein RimM